MAQKSFDKLIEEIGSLSLLEVSELVKQLEDKFGVSADMPVAAAPAQAGAQESAEPAKTEFKVTLQDIGSEKIKVIKAVKTVTSLGLADAKKAVEEAPTVLAEAASKDKAEEMKKALEDAGAKVELA